MCFFNNAMHRPLQKQTKLLHIKMLLTCFNNNYAQNSDNLFTATNAVAVLGFTNWTFNNKCSVNYFKVLLLFLLLPRFSHLS